MNSLSKSIKQKITQCIESWKSMRPFTLNEIQTLVGNSIKKIINQWEKRKSECPMKKTAHP